MVEENKGQVEESEGTEQAASDSKPDTRMSEDRLEAADLGRRIVAAFIDTCVALLLLFGLGWIGSGESMAFILKSHLFWIVPIAYIVLRDMYVGEKPLGLGKRLANLDVICEDTRKPPDLVGSIQRNLLFVFPPLSLCMAGLEVYLLIKSPEKKRFGDHFGKTIVIRKTSN